MMTRARGRRARRLALLGLGLLCLAAALAPAACQGVPMKPEDGRLPQCPGTPNCQNTQEGDLEPLAFEGDPARALARLRTLVEALPRSTVVSAEEDYLHVELRSALFRFVDDLQCLVDREAGVIHLRSASRTGYSDLGVNRRRLEALRAAWEGDAP